eukprot:scaffold61486_cov28-Tisochrysis_lutea.AAC.1
MRKKPSSCGPVYLRKPLPVQNLNCGRGACASNVICRSLHTLGICVQSTESTYPGKSCASVSQSCASASHCSHGCVSNLRKAGCGEERRLSRERGSARVSS